MQAKTVQVKRLSDLATEREIHEFFSFSGEIEHFEIRRELGQSKTAFVTFKDAKALEIALLLSYHILLTKKWRIEFKGACVGLPSQREGSIVDQLVSIKAVENYVPQPDIQELRIADNDVSISQDNISPVAEGKMSPNNGNTRLKPKMLCQVCLQKVQLYAKML